MLQLSTPVKEHKTIRYSNLIKQRTYDHQGRINFKQVDVLLDTGSSVNIIPKNIISQIKGYHNVEYIKTKIATINGEIEVSRGNYFTIEE
ncbi:hypothetical protein TNCV_1112881 [Trichonephila clavipes]|uniref:Uncharacterized protein n=1 Tax=Trichonephila clavipes TaxID=2585209 RepID=A0A8X6RIS1_TRICX|nr:hypothetical protein TNCV_1112881 [Trichonephila clavipes]